MGKNLHVPTLYCTLVHFDNISSSNIQNVFDSTYFDHNQIRFLHAFALSGSCHLERVSNVQIGVECQRFVIVIFFNCGWVLQFRAHSRHYKGASTQKRSFLVICTTFRSDFHVGRKNRNKHSTLNLSFDTLFKWHESDIRLCMFNGRNLVKMQHCALFILHTSREVGQGWHGQQCPLGKFFYYLLPKRCILCLQFYFWQGSVWALWQPPDSIHRQKRVQLGHEWGK